MTTDRDVDRITAAFLREGPAELADRVFDAAFDEIHVTRQRRLPVPWRTPPMSSLTWRVAAIVAAIAIGGLALYATFLRGPTVGIDTPATPLPTAPASFTAPSSVPSSPAATPVAPTPSAAAGVLAPFGYAGGGTIAFTRDDPAVGGLAPFLVDPSGANEARVSIPNGWGGADIRAGDWLLRRVLAGWGAVCRRLRRAEQDSRTGHAVGRPGPGP